MNILITGCNGQLGNEMQRLQAEHPEHNWINTDVAELDITDQAAIEKLVEEREIDGIVNCAAYTAVRVAELDSTGLSCRSGWNARRLDYTGEHGLCVRRYETYAIRGNRHTNADRSVWYNETGRRRSREDILP